MTSLDWIKELVLAEQKMEDSGVIDLSAVDQENLLTEQTIDFLRDVKTAFIEAASTFNQLKASGVGTIKIYGISNTKADFMLFRNGFKLIFSMRRAGEIEVFYSLIGSHFLTPGAAEAEAASQQERDILRAEWGAFGELRWTYKALSVKKDYLVRHYFSRFIRESAK